MKKIMFTKHLEGQDLGGIIASLKSANVDCIPTYPSRAPRKELDFILFQEGINVTNFEVPQVRYSDHLPLVCDFDVVK